MKRIALTLVLILSMLGLAAPEDLPPWVLLLARIRNHIEDQSQRLLNVSCLETVQREYRSAKGKMRPLDTVTLEVLALRNKELFASPGDRKFSDQPPIAYVGSGMLGNGIFEMYLHDVVLAREYVSTEYKGEEELGGRRLARFDYRLPLIWSGQVIQIEEGSGKVSLHGSYWADPQTYDVVRLDLAAGDFPPTLPLTEAVTRINYAPTHLGNIMLLMPQSADVRLEKYSGEARHNRIEFTQCQAFGAQSTIHFAAPDSVQAPPSFSAVAIDDQMRSLPGGLRIAVKLRSQITGQTSVGTLIDGSVAADVVSKKIGLMITAGSPVRGRVRRLERYAEPFPYFVVGLEFTEVEVEGIRYRFYADLLEIDSVPGIERTLSTSSNTAFFGPDEISSGLKETKETLWLPPLPGVASFFFRGSKLVLPNDFRTVWKTRRAQK